MPAIAVPTATVAGVPAVIELTRLAELHALVHLPQ